MSKGSGRRPGTNYAIGYDRIFGPKQATIDIEVRGSFAGADGRRVGTWVLKGPRNGHPAMGLREDGTVLTYGVLNHELSAERRSVMLAARDEPEACTSALQAEPAGQHDASVQWDESLLWERWAEKSRVAYRSEKHGLMFYPANTKNASWVAWEAGRASLREEMARQSAQPQIPVPRVRGHDDQENRDA